MRKLNGQNAVTLRYVTLRQALYIKYGVDIRKTQIWKEIKYKTLKKTDKIIIVKDNNHKAI